MEVMPLLRNILMALEACNEFQTLIQHRSAQDVLTQSQTESRWDNEYYAT
jgi:hypothetical protein